MFIFSTMIWWWSLVPSWCGGRRRGWKKCEYKRPSPHISVGEREGWRKREDKQHISSKRVSFQFQIWGFLVERKILNLRPIGFHLILFELRVLREFNLRFWSAASQSRPRLSANPPSGHQSTSEVNFMDHNFSVVVVKCYQAISALTQSSVPIFFLFVTICPLCPV